MLSGSADLKPDCIAISVVSKWRPWTPANFLDHIEKNDLVITPGDRPDILFVTLGAVASKNYPSPVGILLSGKMTPEPSIRRLLDGIDELAIPIYRVSSDTYRTATNASAVSGRLHPQNERKIAQALGVFETNIDITSLREKVRLTSTASMSPLVFEYSLFERARQERKHIVLPQPEGSESSARVITLTPAF